MRTERRLYLRGLNTDKPQEAKKKPRCNGVGLKPRPLVRKVPIGLSYVASEDYT